MIKLLRVDHRLLHGQVAFSWTQGLGADCILIANDDVPKNDIRKTTIKLAKPAGVKLVIKTIEDAIAALKSGVTEKYKLFIVVESVEDAYRLATAYPEIKEINLGGMKVRENTRNISKAINITPDEEKMVKELVANGCEVEIRQVPNDKKSSSIKCLVERRNKNDRTSDSFRLHRFYCAVGICFRNLVAFKTNCNRFICRNCIR